MAIINKYWRIVFQVGAFFVFGVGSFFFICGIVPFIFLYPATADKKHALAQKLISWCFRFFLRGLSLLGGMKQVAFSGEERLKNAAGVLVIANHPTLLDVVALVRCMPRADCVVKGELWRNWLLKPIISATGYISNEQGEKIVEEGVRRLKSGQPLILFPEGTRSPLSGLGDFNRGFARIAIRSGCPILPVVIRCEPRALMKGQSLFSVPERPFQLSVAVQDLIHVSDFVDPSDAVPVAVRKMTEGVRRYFKDKLNNEETNRS